MKKIRNLLVGIGLIGCIGPFLGIGLKGMDSLEANRELGLIALIMGCIIQVIIYTKEEKSYSNE